MIYYTIPIVAFLCFYAKLSDKRSISGKILLSALVLTILIVGCLRDGVGTDWYSYHHLFANSSNADVEHGFKLIADIVKAIGGGFNFFMALFFLTAFTLKYQYFLRLSPSVALSLLLYSGFWFMTYDLNGIRQGMALAFTGLAFLFAYQRKFSMYCIAMFLAIINHVTACIFLPFYFLVNIRFSRKVFIWGVVVLFLVAMFNITDLLYEQIEILLGDDNILVRKMQAYQSDPSYGSSILFSFTTIHRFFIFFLILFCSRFYPLPQKLSNILVISAFLNIALYLCFAKYELVATRITLYYRFAECISLAALPFIFTKKSKQVATVFLLLTYVVWQIYMTLSIPNGNLLPYKSIF
jgi:hypothetical protein